MHVETLEERQLLAVGPQLVGINPNEGDLLRNGDVRHVAPMELTIRFDTNQVIDAQSLEGIRITRSGGDGLFQNQNGQANDVLVQPGYIGLGELPNEVIVRFAEPLPDDTYRIDIVGDGVTPLRNMDGDVFDNDPNTPGVQNAQIEFTLDLGAKILAVVPQPVTRNPATGQLLQARNEIVIYFNDDDLLRTPGSSQRATNPNFYQLIFTNDTVSNTDDVVHRPTRVVYDQTTDSARLIFERDLNGAAVSDLTQLSGAGTYRLQIGTAETAPLPPLTEIENGAGTSFDTAQNLIFDGTRGVIISGSIDPVSYVLDLPGASDEPGHRNNSLEDHVFQFPTLEDILGTGSVADTVNGVATFYYDFRDYYGNDPYGNPLYNAITSAQKQRAREIFQLYGYYAGVQFVEITETLDEQVLAQSHFTIVTGDMRALDPTIDTGEGGVAGLAGGGLAIMDNAENWDDSFGGNWFRTAMHEIGHLLGLGHTYDLPPGTIMGDQEASTGTSNLDAGWEGIFPTANDIVHVQHLFRPDSVDLDTYRFELTQSGLFSAETFAERLHDSSLLDTVVSLYRETGTGRELIARNDDYFSEDSFLQLELAAGTYYLVVSASGNDAFDPTIENTGFGGTTQGDYQLRLDFRPNVTHGIVDTTGTLLDGDGDGIPGGVHNFWFKVAPTANTLFVDKATQSATPDGSLANPYRNIIDALNASTPGDVVRIVGNAGLDGDLSTVNDNYAYQIGFDRLSRPLDDGVAFNVPKDVTVMIDAGVIIKLRRASINVGSFAPGIDHSGGALQVLGTPRVLNSFGGVVTDANGQAITGSVYFTSLDDESMGGDTTPGQVTAGKSGDWGGIRFRNDVDQNANRFDWEAEGIFLNYVNFADMRYGGGSVVINSVPQVINPIDMITSRPTITNNTIRFSADAAMAANPNAFEETNFHAPQYQSTSFTANYDRVGPEIRGNRLLNNSINGLFIRIQTPAGNQLETMTVSGRWDDTDIVHVLSETLVIAGTPGGPVWEDGRHQARLDASLVIDPGMVVKLDGARISTGMGAQLIAEGTAGRNVIFTSLRDERYGAGGTFDTNNSSSAADAGDWGGLYFHPTSTGSLDHVVLAYAGGISRIEGSFAGFNAIEVHQADVRIANSILENNASGTGGQAPAGRYGRGTNSAGAIFVRGAQPIVVDNIIRNTTGADAAAINIDVNSLNHQLVVDRGRQRGLIERYEEQLDNQGALVRGNVLSNNSLNGMLVRGGVLTTEVVWDDTDIVHLLFDEIQVPNFHTYGGLRLESSASESLVVKLSGPNAGFTATGTPIDITDRIGGILHVIGQPGFPVIFTSLHDDTVGAGRNSKGSLQTDTNNNGSATVPQAGDWRSILLDEYSHDRNVQTIVEREVPGSDPLGVNGTPDTAQYLGHLAPHEKAGDDNRRLGFTVHGFLHQPSDVDVYSFTAEAGTEIWIDIDRTTFALDTVVELIDAHGQTVALSDNSYYEEIGEEAIVGSGRTMNKSGFLRRDYWTINPHDAGMRVVLPGTVGAVGTYHIRVRSSSSDLSILTGGETAGVYQLQIRLREMDEVAGSTVYFADIRYATNGIEINGMPAHSPLQGEAFEADSTANNNYNGHQKLGNLLTADRGTISVAGTLSGAGDIDWYELEITHEFLQGLADPNWASVIFDLDYAAGLARANARISIFDAQGRLILMSNNSNVADDQPGPGRGQNIDDLDRGSTSVLDPYIGTQQMSEGTYYIAITSNAQLPTAMEQFTNPNAANKLVRLEPINSTKRIVEDHISPALGGSQGGSTATAPTTQLLRPDSAVPYMLGDVVLFVTGSSRLATVDPFTGARETWGEDFYHGGGTSVGDLAMRPEQRGIYDFGTLYTYSRGTSNATFYRVDPGTGSLTQVGALGAPEGDWTTNAQGQRQFRALNRGWHNQALTFHGLGVTQRAFGVFSGNDLRNMLLEVNPTNGQVIQGLNSVDASVAGAAYYDGGNQINTLVGGGPGGDVTGLAFLNNTMYAVSDAGGLYRVSKSPTSVSTTHIATITDPEGQRIRFSGLVAGPSKVENGKYANLLFATDNQGRLYAFNTAGELQSIFLNGQSSSVYAGVSGAQGLAFSTLEENLWHIQNERKWDDAGHGINDPFDQSRLESVGNYSYYFGTRGLNGIGGGTHDFAGGAHGSLITETFDLSGYSAQDLPTLYFNYFLSTDGQNYVDGDNPMRDAFRVFVSGDDGQWHLLATNNSTGNVGGMLNDTHEFFQTANGMQLDVQELFDNTNSWRQARINLAAFAGQSNLRLRFDYSTAAAMDLGNPMTTGLELRALGGNVLRDGQGFTLRDPRTGDTQRFEFDLGYTFNLPSGAAIQDGYGFTVDEGGTLVRYEFDKNGSVRTGSLTAVAGAELSTGMQFTINALGGPLVFEFVEGGGTPTNPNAIAVAFTADMTSDEVAAEIAAAINQFGATAVGDTVQFNSQVDIAVGNTPLQLSTRAISISSFLTAAEVATRLQDALQAGGHTSFASYRNAERLNVHGFDLITMDAGFTGVLEGSVGVATGAHAVSIDAGMTADQVAEAMRVEIENVYSGGLTNNVARVHKGIVRIIGYNVTDSGPLGLADSLPGDQFGAFHSHHRGVNNTGEGVYLDDIIIGFAERGEMVTGATTNRNFMGNPYSGERNDIVEGAYQLEIRRGEDYGVLNPLYELFPNQPRQALLRSFDTNDRLAQGTTLHAPRGSDVADGDTFTISDGLNSVTFEYHDNRMPLQVQPGNVPVRFLSSYTAAQMAQAIRNAINSSVVQNQLQIRAALADGSVQGTASTSNRINLFGANVRVDNLNAVGGGGVRITGLSSDGNALRDYLLGPGITAVGDATFIGGSSSAGFFEGGSDVIGIERGIILTTGDALFAQGPNNDGGSTGDSSLSGDADLDAWFGLPINGNVTTDATVLEFTFETTEENLFFNFVFASEEYNEFVFSDYNDVFAFFLDGENLALVPGTNDPVSIDTINEYVNPGFYNDNDPASGQYRNQLGYDGFTSVLTAMKLGLTPGVHTMKLVIADVGDMQWDSAVFLQAGSFSTEEQERTQNRTGIGGVRTDDRGDKNLFLDQGQLLIQQNVISNSLEYGISVDAGARSQPAAVRNLSVLNSDRLVPGVVIANNVLASGGQGGIYFSGDTNPDAAVPFGKIVNNTIYGDELARIGTGIVVANNASPTLMNNIVSGLEQGISIDSSSLTTVVSSTLYHNNTDNSTRLGDFAITLLDTDPLFVDAAGGNFYLAPNSRAIDSSVDSLQDRPELVSVTDPLGIAPSPILAPTRDALGQLRVDDRDVDSPQGLGSNVFKDRGAIERADFDGPTAVLLNPADNDPAGVDRNAQLSHVTLYGTVLHDFVIQLLDSGDASDLNQGAGVDDASVSSGQITLTRDGVVLLEGIDYTFEYDSTNNQIRLRPLAGIWTSGATYEITLNNAAEDDDELGISAGIRDMANNPLRANRSTGETKFTINFTGSLDWGDAPNSYPVTSVNNGAAHVLGSGLYLGSRVTADADGQPSSTAAADSGDDGVVIPSLLRVNSTQTIEIIASQAGKIDAWFDFDGDGTWDDAGEQVLTSVSVSAGVNYLQVNIPVNAKLGNTFARFRLSSDGGLTPYGVAPDGEVEDYMISIGGNPWQNPNNPLDVNGDGKVDRIDAGLVLNELVHNFYSTNGILPTAPNMPHLPGSSIGTSKVPYLDVSGERPNQPGVFKVDLADLAMIVTELVMQAQGASSAPLSSPGTSSLMVAPTTEAAGPVTPPISQPLAAPQSLGVSTPIEVAVEDEAPVTATEPAAEPTAGFRYAASPFSSMTTNRFTTSTLVDFGPSYSTAAMGEAIAEGEQPAGLNEQLFGELDFSTGNALDELLTDIADDVDEAQQEESAHEAAFAELWS